MRLRTAWLPGFPVDGRWQPFAFDVAVDPPALALGATEIRRAERAPVDVPRDVADKVVADGWEDTLRWVLGRAKEGRLSGSAAERYRPTARKAFRGAPPALADAISWWRLFEPSEAPRDLVVAAHPGVVRVLDERGLLAAMRLVRAERAVGLGEILGWLADDRSWRAPATAVVGDDLAARRASARGAPTAAAWWLARLDGASADAVRIVAAVAPGEAVRDAWLADRAGYVDRLARLDRHQIPRSAEAPPTTRALHAFTPPDGPSARAFADGLRALPDLPGMPRLTLAGYVRTPEVMATAARALHSPFPWASLAGEIGDWRVNEALLYTDDPRAVASLLSEPCTPADVDRAVDAVRVGGQSAATLLHAIGDRPVRWDTDGFALSITKEPAALARLAAVIPEQFPVRGSKTLALAGAEALTRWFADHHARRLEGLAGLEALVGRPIAPPPDLAPEPWWQALPAAFHEAVAALARVDDDAEATARRVLAPAIPDVEAIRAEMAWIDAQPPDHPRAASLAKRRALLELRSSPRDLGPRRVANLVADLDRIAWDARLGSWERHARALAGDVLRARLGLVGDLGALFDPRYARVVGGYEALDGAFRRLFTRVLQARLGPPPWDLADPANARLAARYAALGLDLRPWTERDLVVEGRTEEGATFTVRLEADPLEVLRMGEHFGTCLSPGNVNWFSAVANAADWHRQVVYARDADGDVLGRALVCLTEPGGLLTFQLYAHRHEDAIEAALAEFFRRLAMAMRTAVVASGHVPLGVAPRWYDDGPIDRTGAWPALEPKSPFRERLAAVAPADLRAAVVEAFDPMPPAPLVIGWLVGLEEVHGRADLLAALLPDAEALSDEDPGKIELYRRLWLAGAREPVVAWARAHGATALRRHWADPPLDWLFDVAVAEMPGQVARWARALSPCADCGFEREGFAAYQAARAAEALHRPSEARRLAVAALDEDAHRALPYRFHEDARRLAGPSGDDSAGS